MGIVKISDKLHEDARICSKSMSRSINAQAEHWMHIGMLVESNPLMSYTDVIQHMLKESRQQDAMQPLDSVQNLQTNKLQVIKND